MTDRLDEIQQRLDAATPGPWETRIIRQGTGQPQDIEIIYPKGRKPDGSVNSCTLIAHMDSVWACCTHCTPDFFQDAELIAHAPDDIRHLKAIVDKLPKCWRLDESGKRVQDAPVAPGMELWWLHKPDTKGAELRRGIVNLVGDGYVDMAFDLTPSGGERNFIYEPVSLDHLWATREAAQAAKKEGADG